MNSGKDEEEEGDDEKEEAEEEEEEGEDAVALFEEALEGVMVLAAGIAGFDLGGAELAKTTNTQKNDKRKEERDRRKS